jgi:hypothetical protein
VIGSSNTHGVLVGDENGVAQAVWKFELAPDGTGGGRCRVRMPRAAKPMSVGTQGDGRFYLWAVVTPVRPADDVRTFYLIGTGRPIPREAHTYLGRITHGVFEFHVFEGRQ